MSMNIAQCSASWFSFHVEHTCVARLAHTSKRSASVVRSNFESNDAPSFKRFSSSGATQQGP
jgi:hypothetical protein